MLYVSVKPTNLNLSGVEHHVVQGTNVLLLCDVFGARPAAEVKWFNNSVLVTNESLISTVPEAMVSQCFESKGTSTLRKETLIHVPVSIFFTTKYHVLYFQVKSTPTFIFITF